ncbi:MAG: DUF1460 domain-containing protein [Muribaculaceae bacterium]|nr:DUF1460 domain-containing protein [Muribaculaceae bacterium]
MYKSFLISLILFLITPAANAEGMPGVRFHNIGADTTRLQTILSRHKGENKNTGDLMLSIAEEFIGTPYVAHTLEWTPEMVTVNTEELDCTTFVDNVMALAATVSEGRDSWRDAVFNLKRFRYRGGTPDGYASRLHYICDWAVDNIHRGNITDATTSFPAVAYQVRSINYMSTHSNAYPALADSITLAEIKAVEGGYRNHRFPYIKTASIGSKAVKNSFRNGDIIALVCKLNNLDVTHLGLIKMINGVPYLLHASSSHSKVEVSEVPLYEFLKRNPAIMGVRAFRLN